MTRIDVESRLDTRWGTFADFVFVRARPKRLTPVDLTPTGSNPIYSDAIGYGLSSIGWPANDPANVVDGDISRVDKGAYYQFVELAEYRWIETLLGNFTQTTESAQDRSQDWSKLADRAMKRASELATLYAAYLIPYDRRASSGTVRTVPITAGLPTFQPGAGRVPRGGAGGGRYPWW